jgi:hypothetical protein
MTDGDSTDVAATVTGPGFELAVNRPDVLIVPAAPDTDHVTAVLKLPVPVTVTENC